MYILIFLTGINYHNPFVKTVIISRLESIMLQNLPTVLCFLEFP